MIKVLHVRGGECVEASLIASYEKAGADVFLFDVVTEDGRVGSTGQALDPAVVAPLIDKLTRPFLLAGGISDTNRAELRVARRAPSRSSASTSIPTPATRTAQSHRQASGRSARVWKDRQSERLHA